MKAGIQMTGIGRDYRPLSPFSTVVGESTGSQGSGNRLQLQHEDNDDVYMAQWHYILAHCIETVGVSVKMY